MDYIATLREQLFAMGHGFVAALPNLVVALLIIIVTWLLAKFAVRIADKLTNRTKLKPDLQQLLETLVRIVIWVVGLLLAAAVAVPGFTPAGLIAGLGIGALAIGFAFQDTFENFLAGIFVMLRNNMEIGDIIEVEGITGRIEKITLRETWLRKLSNELYVIPNAMLFKNPVEVLTNAPIRRDELMVGVAYDSDLEEVEAAIRRAFEGGIAGVITDKEVGVFAREFGGSSIDWLVQWWSESSAPRDMRDVRTKVIRAIKREFDTAGIDIPFPIQTNLFPEPLRIDGSAATAD